MAGVIPNPNLNPEAMPWAREITKRLETGERVTEGQNSNITAALKANASAMAAAETLTNTVTEIEQGQVSVMGTPAAPGSVTIVSSSSGWTDAGAPFASSNRIAAQSLLGSRHQPTPM